MDRRQRKTREAIFQALTALLAKKEFSQITVSEIIEKADVGRATFYAHFETKDFLLKELCEELFCHIFDAVQPDNNTHKHIFDCEAPDSVFLHLAQHLQNNDNQILELLASPNNELFMQYFKKNLKRLASFIEKKNATLPDDFWAHHVATTFVETMKWWIDNGMQESSEEITEYFFKVI